MPMFDRLYTYGTSVLAAGIAGALLLTAVQIGRAHV